MTCPRCGGATIEAHARTLADEDAGPYRFCPSCRHFVRAVDPSAPRDPAAGDAFRAWQARGGPRPFDPQGRPVIDVASRVRETHPDPPALEP